MRCHVCHDDYKLRHKNYLQCCNCLHGFQPFDVEPVSYHRDLYRLDSNHHRSKGEIDNKGQIAANFHASRKLICEKRLKSINSILAKKYSCLDIGSGAGTFAHAIKPLISEVECLELCPALVAESKRLGFNTHQEDFLSWQTGSNFDLVTAWHVLEHVREIKSFVEKMSMLSREWVVIEVPCNRKPNRHFDGHFHHFNRKSLTLLIESCGLHLYSIQDGIQMPAILAIAKKL